MHNYAARSLHTYTQLQKHTNIYKILIIDNLHSDGQPIPLTEMKSIECTF